MCGNSRVFIRFFLTALALVAGCGFTSPSARAQTAAPQTTTATYDDWLLRCDARPDAQKVCEIVQGIQGQQGLIAQIVIGRIAKTDPFQLIVQLPAGIWLPAGATIEFGNKTPAIPVAFTRCLQACFAVITLKPDQLNALKTRTTPASLIFEDGARNRVQLPLSLKGFLDALEASQKG